MKDLQYYATAFSALRTDGKKNKYSLETKLRAPHKPILLLSIIDLIESGVVQSNFFEFNLDLKFTFNTYWELTPYRQNRSPNIYLPFFHLKSAGFWHLVARPGQELFLANRSEVRGAAQLVELVAGARLDHELFVLLQDPPSRQVIRDVLLITYFSEHLQATMRQRVVLNRQVYLYERWLKNNMRPQPGCEYSFTYSQPEPALVVRDAGFRKVVVEAYAHQCAFCRTKIITDDGHTAVEAAHIVPWSRNQNDDPRNGMALCKLCHWGFDEGLLSVDAALKIMQSRILRHEINNPGVLAHFGAVEIHKPENPLYWPLERYLKVHREEVFRK